MRFLIVLSVFAWVFALVVKRLESERTLLKGHFSLIAKRYHVTVKELKKAYKESKKI